MYEIGRLCVKIAGRDARQHAVIIDVLEAPFVLIDGQVRRRKCNILHLEPLPKVLHVKKNASHEDVVDALKREGIDVVERKAKGEKPAKPAKAGRTKKQKGEGKAEKPARPKARPAKAAGHEAKGGEDAPAQKAAAEKPARPKASKPRAKKAE